VTTSALESRIVARIDERSEALYRDLERFVAIPTGERHRPGLDELRGICRDRLAALGATITMRPGAARPEWLTLPDEPAVAEGEEPPTMIATRLDAAGSGTRVLIAGHLDTVHDPCGPFRVLTREGDDIARGPGAADMKGGIVLALHALEVLSELGVPLRWSFLLNSDEETGSFHSSRHIEDEARRHDLGIALEPAAEGGALVVGRMGTGQFRIDCAGRSAHVGRDHAKGISAVKALARAILEVEGFTDGQAGRIVNVGPLRGGRIVNAVPDAASAWGNVRFADAATERDLGARFDALNTAEGALPAVRVRRIFNRPAKPLIPAVARFAEGVRDAARDLASAGGSDLPVTTTGGVCDGNIMQSVGLPTLDTLGVRGGNLHRTDEFIEVRSLVERCRLLAVVLSRIATGRIAPELRESD
jgi:glutamate carboxypeptidase